MPFAGPRAAEGLDDPAGVLDVVDREVEVDAHLAGPDLGPTLEVQAGEVVVAWADRRPAAAEHLVRHRPIEQLRPERGQRLRLGTVDGHAPPSGLHAASLPSPWSADASVCLRSRAASGRGEVHEVQVQWRSARRGVTPTES